MSEGQRATLLAYLRRLVGAGATDGSDAELLERFAAQRDEAAFEALLRRHGPLVWSVCRRVLAEEHAAEDAFQATFLVLVRKARSVSKRASIRSWLYGVALRVALRARQQEQLRRRREQETPIRNPGEAIWQDVRSILDEEIQRLPEKYRLPLILCYLEGQTNDEAARLLNCPRGTIATRLARARERLRVRLLRHGVTLSAGTLATMLTDNAVSASVPPLLVAQAANAALMGVASVSITALTEGVIQAMFLSKVKMTSALVLALTAMGGAGMGTYYLRAQALTPKTEAPSKKADEAAANKRAVRESKARLEKLLKERRERAEQALKINWDLYRAGANEPATSTPVTLQMLIDGSKRLLKAELEMSKKKAERLEALERHLKLMKEVADITERQFNAGRISQRALASAQYEQLDAEIELEREKAR